MLAISGKTPTGIQMPRKYVAKLLDEIDDCPLNGAEMHQVNEQLFADI